jgi:Uncharacterised protein family (UPF0158)
MLGRKKSACTGPESLQETVVGRKATHREKEHMITLPNWNSIDLDMLEVAMDDSDPTHRYFLHLVTGEVIFISDDLGSSDEDERLLEDIDGSNDYVAIERIPSHEAYHWMVDFVDDMVVPVDERVAEILSMALSGKGAFRRFKDTLYRVDDQWLQAWYQWKQPQLEAAIDEWLKSVL